MAANKKTTRSAANAADRKPGAATMSQRKDLTIDEVVKDPMIRMLMKADRVDPRSFETMLRTLADAQGHGRKAPHRFLEDPGQRRIQRLSRVAKAFGQARASGEAYVSW
ncbi:hypothetical protein [Mesorhizobium sp.]|uniref:hypothetical protein n=2 Tax=Mesorhizobium sp. TaxID=1871066 RepID=UPI0025DCD396|nr:hypothetical protein [Mesorhizobium sp.]